MLTDRFEHRSSRRFRPETNRNILGNYTREEIDNFISSFNLTAPREINQRLKYLRAIFSAQLLAGVFLPGLKQELFRPEKFSDLEKVFRGSEEESYEFFRQPRIAILGSHLVAYGQELNSLPPHLRETSRWGIRLRQFHVRFIGQLEIKDEDQGLILIINI